ncbi:MAG: DNA-directed RNA polymerase subunit alpha [Thaumarchaeota archaeon 13_1_20CM_2_39_11]|nr:MAG: DNA-directed RNA polymerase subunit alpha [Thaumarchaeota archaeon 13_1_40CM_2_39_13_1]OLE43909.1 MAG: DNA-directed RNA polymerase subunit alpha [Thaumarchaeota archaeon 13_1_20CM_2_39_11]
MTSLEIVEQSGNRIVVKLKGVPLQYANALRRICLSGVPTFAVDDVVMIENSSVLADEGVSHRLAMIPLRTDLSRFVEPSECDCHSELGCSRCRILLMLDSGSSDTTRTVTSSDLSSEDEVVKPVSPNIPIAVLAPNQKLKLEAYARLGRGSDHAKWNSASVAALIDGNNPDEHILTLETVGSLTPAEVIRAAVDELEKRLGEFKQTVAASG